MLKRTNTSINKMEEEGTDNGHSKLSPSQTVEQDKTLLYPTYKEEKHV